LEELMAPLGIQRLNSQWRPSGRPLFTKGHRGCYLLVRSVRAVVAPAYVSAEDARSINGRGSPGRGEGVAREEVLLAGRKN
jgi:hypothetical protein